MIVLGYTRQLVGLALHYGGETMRTMDGIVTLVQESRFQLIDDQGIGHLFVLSHSASAEPSQLVPLQKQRARVRVSYKVSPTLIANVAHKIALQASAS